MHYLCPLLAGQDTSPELKKRFDDMGARIIGGTPGEFASFLSAEIGRWARAVKESGAVQN